MDQFEEKKKLRINWRSKKFLIGVIILVVLILSGTALYMVWQTKQEEEREQAKKQAQAVLETIQSEKEATAAEEQQNMEPELTEMEAKAGVVNDPKIHDARIEATGYEEVPLEESETLTVKSEETKETVQEDPQGIPVEEVKTQETPKEEDVVSETPKEPAEEKVETTETQSESVQTKGESSSYQVRSKDTFFSIAKRFYGNGKYYKALKEYNNLTSSEVIVGQKIMIPSKLGEVNANTVIYDGNYDALIAKYTDSILTTNSLTKETLKKGMLLAIPK